MAKGLEGIIVKVLWGQVRKFLSRGAAEWELIKIGKVYYSWGESLIHRGAREAHSFFS